MIAAVIRILTPPPVPSSATWLARGKSVPKQTLWGPCLLMMVIRVWRGTSGRERVEWYR